MNSTALRIKRGMEYVCVTRANDHGSLCPDWGIDRGRGLSRVWGGGVLRWDFGSQKVPVPEAISIALSSCAIVRSRIALVAGIETGMSGHTLSLFDAGTKFTIVNKYGDAMPPNSLDLRTQLTTRSPLADQSC
jgi:hypothetical protein